MRRIRWLNMSWIRGGGRDAELVAEGAGCHTADFGVVG